MNLLDLFVKITVDDQASGKMDGITSGMIAKGQLMASGIQSAMSAAASAVRQVIGGAVDAYKEYEQLAGGMETFFGDAADTVIQNAQNAYRTAGMSANQYMSTVSMFATSLVRSVSEGNAKTTTDSGQAAVDALQGQYDSLKETLSDELTAMQQGFQDANKALSRALADELDEMRKAQQKEVKQRQKQLDQEYEARQKELQNEIDAMSEAGQQAVDERKAALDREYDELSKSLDRRVDAYQKATDAHIKEIDREYKESLKNIDREEYERLKAIDEQIAAIQGLTDAEEKAAKAQKQATKKAELEKVLASAKTSKGRAKAQEQLNEYMAQIEAEQTQQLRKEQIERLKDEKASVKEQASERKDALKEAHDEELSQYKEQRADGLKELRESNKQELDEQKRHNEEVLSQMRADNAKKVEQRRAEVQNELKVLKESQTEEMEQLREAQADELKQRQRANEDVMSEQQRSQQEQLASARKANEQQLSELKKRIDAQKALVKSGADSMGEFVTASAKDQEEAARLAQVATIDMADNANKMGTSMEMIQNAYQGFSKQNFMMLDNLKLGYGGTKSEMERLLSDAESIKAKQGEVADYSIDSFADIVEAIHTVQQEYEVSGYSVEELQQKLNDMSLSEQDLRRVSQDLGISYEEAMQKMKDGSLTAQDAIILTGTTSYEASSTIEGSFNRMQASWENWLLSLANPEMDLGETTNQLVDSVIIAAENVIPRVIEVIGRLGEAIAEHAPEAVGKLTEAFSNVIPPEFQGTIDAIGQKLQELGEHWQPVIDKMTELAQKVAPKVQEVLRYIWENSITQALLPALGRLGDSIGKIMDAFGEWLDPIRNVAGFLGNAFVGVIGIVVDVISLAISIIADIMTALKEFGDWIDRTAGAIGDFVGDALRFFDDFGRGVWQTIQDVIDWFWNLPSRILNAIGNVGRLLWNTGVNIVQGLVDGIANNFWAVGDTILGGLNDAVNSALKFLGIASPSKLFKWMGEMSVEGLGEGMEGKMPLIESAMGDINDLMRIDTNMGVSTVGNRWAGSAAGSGNTLNVYVDKLSVRDDRDIYKVSEQLNDLWNREMAGALA